MSFDKARYIDRLNSGKPFASKLGKWAVESRPTGGAIIVKIVKHPVWAKELPTIKYGRGARRFAGSPASLAYHMELLDWVERHVKIWESGYRAGNKACSAAKSPKRCKTGTCQKPARRRRRALR